MASPLPIDLEQIAVGIAEIEALLAFVIDRRQQAHPIVEQLEIGAPQLAGVFGTRPAALYNGAARPNLGA